MINLFCAGFCAGLLLASGASGNTNGIIANTIGCFLNLFIWYIGYKVK